MLFFNKNLYNIYKIMTSANRFLTTSDQNHDQATEKTLSDMDNFLQSGNLEVNISGDLEVGISGLVDTGITELICNAGNDLNTSLLALESGGTLSSIDTSNTAILLNTFSIISNTGVSNLNEALILNSLSNLEDISLGVSKNTFDTFDKLDTGTSYDTGNSDLNTQRVVIATDDINQSAINTATTEIASAVNSSRMDVNISHLGDNPVNVSASGVFDVFVLNSIPSNIGNLVDVRANRINTFRLQEMVMASDGLSSTDTPESLGDSIGGGILITVPTVQIGVTASSIGSTGSDGDDGAVIEIQYYANNFTGSITTVNVTLLNMHAMGQLLPFAWFRIVRLRHISGTLTGVVFIGDNTFAGGFPSGITYKNMAGSVGVSRNGNTYFNPNEAANLTLMTISSGFNASGAVYRLDCRFRRDATSSVDEMLLQTYIRQGPYLLDYSNINQLPQSSGTGMDLIFTITRTNSTHNEPVVIHFGAVAENLS